MSTLFLRILFVTYVLQKDAPLTDQSRKPDLGQRVAAHRSQLGLSQTAVAERAGLAASYLSRIENGKIFPTMPTAQKIATALPGSAERVTGTDTAPEKESKLPSNREGDVSDRLD
jgi:transcriptional regulator with XRE-family HTH domain